MSIGKEAYAGAEAIGIGIGISIGIGIDIGIDSYLRPRTKINWHRHKQGHRLVL